MDSTNTLRIVIDSKGAKSNADALDKSLKNLETQGEKTSSSVHAMSGSIKALTGAMAGYLTINQAVSRIDAYANLQNRLKLITNSQIELNRATEDTFNIAQKTYQEWSSVVQVYQRFSENAENLGINMQKTAELTETVSKAVAISGASAASAEAALTQFGQSLASGVFRGEEFNSVAEQTPALLKAIAAGLGVSIGQLREMAYAGKITTDVLVKALTNAASDVDEKFGRIQMTIGQSLTYLSNQTTQFASNASTAGNLAASSIKAVADNLEMLTGVAMVAGAYYVGSLIPAITSATAAGYGKVKQLAEQVAVQQAAVVAERAAAAQNIITLQAIQASNAAKVAEIQTTLSLLQAEKALEVERLKAQINQQGRIASVTRMAELRKIEAQVTRELAAAELALGAAKQKTAAAEAASTAAATASVGAGRALLGVLGGPVGIGVTVAAVAASYLLLSDNTDKSTESLRANGVAAQDAINKFKEFDDVQKRSQLVAEKESLDNLSNSYERLSQKLVSSTLDLSRHNSMSSENARQISALGLAYKSGELSLDKLSSKINESTVISQKSKDAFNTLAGEVRRAGGEFSSQQTAVNGMRNALNGVAIAADNAAIALKKQKEVENSFSESLQDRRFKALVNEGFLKQGRSAEQAQAMTETAVFARQKGVVATKQMYDEALNVLKVEERGKKIVDARNEALKASAQHQKASAAASAKAAKEEAKQAEQLESEINSIRERYTYQYADKAKQIEMDLIAELNDMRKAGMSKEMQERATKWYEFEKKAFEAQLDYENKEFKLNEREKLAYRMHQAELATMLDRNLTKEQKQTQLNAIAERTNFELDQIVLASDKRIFEAEREFITRQEQIKKLGELERREIQLNTSLTDEDRKRLEMASMRKTDMESNEARASAWGDYESMSGELYGTSELDNIKTQLEERRAIIEEARAQDLIDTEEYNSRLRDIEFDAWAQRQQFNITQAQSTFGAATEIMKNAFGEQSKAYQVMFAIEKSFAIANAGLAMVNNISKAASMGFPANLPLIAGAMAQAAQISSLIASVVAPKTTGFADGGYTGDGGKYDVAGLVHRGEIVWSQDDIKRAGGKNVVEAMRTGQNQQQSSPSVSPINQTIANFIDPALFEQFLRSDAGQRAFVNTISDNSTAIRRAL